ncbi:hypothetical protein [Acanthopleuribacter pedis]|uniref:Transposase IS200-like domain-containing protein n=1 Tax=Acanthopleuribacter pedis TaxID=442870 RepID=A0A8J7QSN0_9BACT|nr:hypothetical protein [Acanthopleuribacter pedis]MBO1323425.1 hypothetical protein [Acanthopleuribacter pedis]
MTRPRSETINDQVEGIQHCISRCVRRAHLQGEDPLTGNNYAHRKTWLHQRLIELSRIFYLDVCGYALMDNHLHTILRNRPDLAAKGSDRDVAVRWLKLFPKRSEPNDVPVEPSEDEVTLLLMDESRIKVLRKRLVSISWFHRCLKEFIARKANAEDGCTGRFWEGRFKNMTLLDDAAVLTCLTYVELNPIRAKVAETPETSKFTSAEERIRGHLARCSNASHGAWGILGEPTAAIETGCDDWLCPLRDTPDRRGFLPMDLEGYLELLDWTGRRLVAGKAGAIPDHLPPMLTRLSVNHQQWLNSTRHFESMFFSVAGTETHMKQAAKRMGQGWVRGLSAGKTAFLD